MKITSVEYSELQTGSNYTNKKVGAVATVGDDEEPELVLVELRTWVQAQLTDAPLVQTLEARKHQLQEDVVKLEKRQAFIKGLLNKFRQAANDVPIDELPW